MSVTGGGGAVGAVSTTGDTSRRDTGSRLRTAVSLTPTRTLAEGSLTRGTCSTPCSSARSKRRYDGLIGPVGLAISVGLDGSTAADGRGGEADVTLAAAAAAAPGRVLSRAARAARAATFARSFSRFSSCAVALASSSFARASRRRARSSSSSRRSSSSRLKARFSLLHSGGTFSESVAMPIRTRSAGAHVPPHTQMHTARWVARCSDCHSSALNRFHTLG